MPLTITEGLADIKTIGKRIEKKTQFIAEFIARQEGLKDPLANEGGSRQAIQKERQAIVDLEERLVSIRRAIQNVNASATISLNGTTRTIADWLVWRREVSAGKQAFLNTLRGGVAKIRRDALAKGYAVAASSAEARAMSDVIVNVDEAEIAKEAETLEEVLGALDGQLSLKNATVTIDV